MGRAATTLSDYLLVAQEKRLKYLQDTIADSIEERVPWLCLITGQHFMRSYAQVKANNFASPGQRVRDEYLDKYHEVAAENGIEFIYEGDNDPCYFPQNTKTPCRWRGENGQIVYVPYYELAYGRETQQTKAWLGKDVFLSQPTQKLSDPNTYRHTGILRGLDLLDSREITSDDMPVMWMDKRTRSIFAASFNEIDKDENPAPGQKYYRDNFVNYELLAKRLGIKFLYYGGGDIFPQSDVHPARWEGLKGVVWASYSELSGKIRSSLKNRLGV